MSGINAFSLMAKLSLDKKDYTNGLDEAKNEGQSFGSKIGSGLASVAKLSATALAGATTAVAGFGMKAVQTGMEFDSAMSQVEATMGDNAKKMIEYNGQTVESIDALREFAQEMGASTAFSASQASEALNYMALAGYDAETSMSMLPTVLNLASAGGIELASASDMVTDAQSALGLSLEETEWMVDRMAKASQKSNTSVAQLGEAFLTVGGTAKDLAGGTTELSQVLGILADNGVKGAEGGTALRNIMLALEAPTDKASDAMEALGLTVFDEQGNLRDMQSIFADLNESMADMSSGEKTQVLNNIFNKVDLKSVNALLATNEDRWNELYDSIVDCGGSAEEMANVQLDNLSGDITLLKSAFEGFQIAVSEGGTDTLRSFVQYAGESLGTLTQAYKEGGVDGAMSAMGDILNKGINLVSEYLPKIVESGSKVLTSLIDGISQNIGSLSTSALSIITSLVNAITTNLPKIIESGATLLINLAQGLADSLPELVPQAIDMILTIVDTLLDNVDMLVDTSIDLVLALADGLVRALPKLIEKVPEILLKLVKAFATNAPKMFEASLKLIESLWNGLKDNLPTLLEKIPELLSNIVQALKDGASAMIEIGAEWIEKLWEGIGNKIEWIKEKISGLVGNVKSWLKKFFGGGDEGGEESDQPTAKGGSSSSGGITKASAPITQLDSAYATASTASTSARSSKEIVKAINDMNKNMYSNMVDAISNGLTWEWDDRQLGRMVKNYA